MRDVLVVSDGSKFGQDISIGSFQLRSDEPVELNGADTGPEPHELLLAALGACTSMTLRVYAERKGWPLRRAQVTLTGAQADGKYVISRQIIMDGELDAEQRQRLLEIADKCPVHRTLTGEVQIETKEVKA
jgi:putative redox protein